MNIVLMAGGGGTRLWPLSRRHKPKQFLRLGGQTTLLEQTYQRARALVDANHIFVATVEEYREKVAELLPEVPTENIFYEPERRDNAAAFAAVAVQLSIRGLGNEPTVWMWSDHVFTAEEAYIEDVRKIPDLIEQAKDTIVIVGHVATSPETGLGYIEAGEPLVGHADVFRVRQFKEKPDVATAETYVAAGTYFWNMGSISTRPAYLLQELAQQTPAFDQGIEKLRQAFTNKNADEIASAYRTLPKISIDYALLEKTPRLLVVTGDYGWSDIGNWAAVKDIFGTQGDHAPAGHHIHVSSQNNYVYNTTDKVVSLIGLEDTIVVVTDDAVLVTKKDRSHQVKDVVARLETDRKTSYL